MLEVTMTSPPTPEPLPIPPSDMATLDLPEFALTLPEPTLPPPPPTDCAKIAGELAATPSAPARKLVAPVVMLPVLATDKLAPVPATPLAPPTAMPVAYPLSAPD